MVLGAHWWFFFCAAGDIAAGVAAHRRYVLGKRAGHGFVWQFGRLLLAVCAPFAGWDCLKVFAGGFWMDLTENDDPPFFAYSIYALVLAHLFLVPLLLIPNTEYEIAARAWAKAARDGTQLRETAPCMNVLWRIVTWVLAWGLAAIGVLNTVQRWRVTSVMGGMKWRNTVYPGIVEWDLASEKDVEHQGYFFVEPELIGAFAFGGWAVLCGGLIWGSTNSPAYFVITFLALVGQGIGGPPPIRNALFKIPVNGVDKDLFKFCSNAFEVVSFWGMFFADWMFCNSHKQSGLADAGDADIEI